MPWTPAQLVEAGHIFVDGDASGDETFYQVDGDIVILANLEDCEYDLYVHSFSRDDNGEWTVFLQDADDVSDVTYEDSMGLEAFERITRQ